MGVTEPGVAVGEPGAANDASAASAALRDCMARFAAVRAAQRSLPAAAFDLRSQDAREQRARALRAEFEALADHVPDGAAPDEETLLGFAKSIDRMEREVIEQFDTLDFAALRASLPRAAEAHRREVIALLELLLGDRSGLLERLAQIEYVITILATEEIDGRRNIVHDPVTLTPVLAAFDDGGALGPEQEALAMDLFQSASLDADREGPLQDLRDVRIRKRQVGLGCFSPHLLRAIVTYNARIFNRVESVAEASRVSDERLETLLEGGSAATSDVAEDWSIDHDADARETGSADAAPGESVFVSQALDTVADAVRRRIRGVPIGSCASERVALALDLSGLDAIERQAFLSDERDERDSLLVRTALVGMICRDAGVAAAPLDEIGVSTDQVSTRWVAELNERLGRLIAELVADGSEYDLASILSSIKAKHLLAPMSALKGARRTRRVEVVGADEAAAEMRAAGREALEDVSSDIRLRSTRGRSEKASFGVWPTGRRAIAAAMLLPLVIVFGAVSINAVGESPSTVAEMDIIDLADMSPYVASAYRSRSGRGGLVIGRLHPSFSRLSREGTLEQANEMVPRFRELNATDVMLYDARGVLQVHYRDGGLRRPAPPAAPVANAAPIASEQDGQPKAAGHAWRIEAGGEGAGESASGSSDADGEW